jgi:hypothetical protein
MPGKTPQHGGGAVDGPGYANALTRERAIEQLQRIYARAGTSLERTLSGVKPTTEFTQMRANEAMREVREIQRGLDTQCKAWVGSAVPPAYNKGVRESAHRIRELRDYGSAKKIAIGSRIHTQAVNVLSQAIVDDMAAANSGMQRGIVAHIMRTRQNILRDSELSETIATGLVRGEARRTTSHQIAAMFEEKLGKGQLIPIRTRTGGLMHFTPEHYGELVARARTREAVTQGTVNACMQAGMDLVQISMHEDSCPECEPYEGRIYSISGEHPDFPHLDEEPPYHPNCKHVLMPVTETALEMRGEYDAMVKISNDPNARFDTVADFRKQVADLKRDKDVTTT